MCQVLANRTDCPLSNEPSRAAVGGGRIRSRPRVSTRGLVCLHFGGNIGEFGVMRGLPSRPRSKVVSGFGEKNIGNHHDIP